MTIRVPGHGRTIRAAGNGSGYGFIVMASAYVARCACGEWSSAELAHREDAAAAHERHKADVVSGLWAAERTDRRAAQIAHCRALLVDATTNPHVRMAAEGSLRDLGVDPADACAAV